MIDHNLVHTHQELQEVSLCSLVLQQIFQRCQCPLFMLWCSLHQNRFFRFSFSFVFDLSAGVGLVVFGVGVLETVCTEYWYHCDGIGDPHPPYQGELCDTM